MKQDIIILGSLIIIGAIFIFATNKRRDKQGFPDFGGQRSVPTSIVRFSEDRQGSDFALAIPSVNTTEHRVSHAVSYAAGASRYTGVISHNYSIGGSRLFTSSSSVQHSYGSGASLGGSSAIRSGSVQHGYSSNTYSVAGSPSVFSHSPAYQRQTTDNVQSRMPYTAGAGSSYGSYRMVPIYNDGDGRWYDDETGEECDPPSYAVGYVDPDDPTRMWNGTAWVLVPSEVDPIGDTPWIVVLVMVLSYILSKKRVRGNFKSCVYQK